MKTEARPKAVAAPREGYGLVPLARLYPSPDNPRTHYDEASLRELAASFAAHGVVEPLIVRPWPKGRTIGSGAAPYHEGSFEIVAGHRRWRAADIAGLESVPCIVRELDDAALLEIMFIENGQREDLTPLEQGAGYRKLLERGGYDVAGIAAKIGKGEGYVRARLSVDRLGGLARRAMEAGLLTLSHALLIAPLSAEDQIAAVEFAIGRQEEGGLRVASWNGKAEEPSRLRSWIRNGLTPDLERAPFDKADPTLVPEMGPCDACPFRTLNGLFPEPGGEDRCLKRKCYALKLERHVERAKAANPDALVVSNRYSNAPAGALDSGGWTEIRRKSDPEVRDEDVIAWASDLADEGPMVEVDPRSFDAVYVAITRDPDLYLADEEDAEEMEAAEKRLADAHAAGAFEFQETTFVRAEGGARCVALGAQDEPLPADARMALVVDGPNAGSLIPVRLYGSGQKAAEKLADPETAKAEAQAERAETRERSRLRKAEMIARRRALDAVVAAIERSDDESSRWDLTTVAAGIVPEIVAVSALKIAQSEFSHIYDSAFPPEARHPGRRRAKEILGAERRSPGGTIFQMPLRQVLCAWAVAATYDEVFVPEGAVPRDAPMACLRILCAAFLVDLDELRGAADWDTLSKKQKEEREKQEKRESVEAIRESAHHAPMPGDEPKEKRCGLVWGSAPKAGEAPPESAAPAPDGDVPDPDAEDRAGKALVAWAQRLVMESDPGAEIGIEPGCFEDLYFDLRLAHPSLARDYERDFDEGFVRLSERKIVPREDGVCYQGATP